MAAAGVAAAAAAATAATQGCAAAAADIAKGLCVQNDAVLSSL
jgi:hypothetical protein